MDIPGLPWPGGQVNDVKIEPYYRELPNGCRMLIEEVSDLYNRMRIQFYNQAGEWIDPPANIRIVDMHKAVDMHSALDAPETPQTYAEDDKPSFLLDPARPYAVFHKGSQNSDWVWLYELLSSFGPVSEEA